MKETDIEDLVTELRDLKIRIAQLERQRPSGVSHKYKLQTGDRVQITNRIRKPSSWPKERQWTEERERLAVIPQVTTDRIYITTDNGNLTWRHPASNIKKAHCNQRRPPRLHQGGRFPQSWGIWFNEHSIANILSLSDVCRVRRVTMDSSDTRAIHVHRKDGTIMTISEHPSCLCSTLTQLSPLLLPTL
jgi:hypothetical protein